MSNRRTSRRSAIVRVVRDAPGPLRPLEILDLASRIVPTLGIATVYRQLRRLQDAGEVRAVDLGVNDVRNEPTDREHHHHSDLVGGEQEREGSAIHAVAVVLHLLLTRQTVTPPRASSAASARPSGRQYNSATAPATTAAPIGQPSPSR